MAEPADFRAERASLFLAFPIKGILHIGFYCAAGRVLYKFSACNGIGGLHLYLGINIYGLF